MRLLREVEELRRRRDELTALHVARLLNTGRQDHLVSAVLEYYDTFSHGFAPPSAPAIFRFLHAHVDRDVFCYGATGLGMDAWVEQWRRYTKLFPSILIRVRATTCSWFVDARDVHSLTDPSTTATLVEAQGRMGGTISRSAITAILPHLLPREDLVKKLLGKYLDCPVCLRFHFNGAGKIIRMDLDADFLDGFCRVDGVSVVELAHIMEHAEIGENSMLPPAP